jgi:hypothetical protein
VLDEIVSDSDHREFISAGTAAGISAAFGAPVGGVLFAMEEACSFWSRKTAWRCFMAAVFATFTMAQINKGWVARPRGCAGGGGGGGGGGGRVWGAAEHWCRWLQERSCSVASAAAARPRRFSPAPAGSAPTALPFLPLPALAAPSTA